MNLGEYKNRLCALFFPVRSYNESFVQSGLFQLSNRRQELVDILFKEVLQNEPDKLHGLLLALTVKKKNTRKFRPVFKTNRFRNPLLSILSRLKQCLYSFTICDCLLLNFICFYFLTNLKFIVVHLYSVYYNLFFTYFYIN